MLIEIQHKLTKEEIPALIDGLDLLTNFMLSPTTRRFLEDAIVELKGYLK